MTWIYLSPHFDDAALSCGGLVWEQSQSGIEVEIWTICGGKPQQKVNSPLVDTLHKRWKTGALAVEIRQKEDIMSCRLLKAEFRHLNTPDCIYRMDNEGNPLYNCEEAIFGELNDFEADLVEKIAQPLKNLLPVNAQVVCPLAIGGHVDHRLTRKVIEQTGISAWYYGDYPYVMKNIHQLNTLKAQGWISTIYPISEKGFYAWLEGIGAHRSQLDTFWKNHQEMENAIREYLQINQGIELWRPG